MRASIVIASHNESDRLWKTVRSCLATTRGLKPEIIIADDASSDGSIDELHRRYPRVRVIASRKRKGCSATKDAGARESRGDVIVFLDGHCKPEPGAIAKLVADVEGLDGQVVVTPSVPILDVASWKNSEDCFGQCFLLELRNLDCGWTGLEGMWMRGRFHESPGVVGCCVAVSRKLYERLRGFDRHMLEWGIEDIDFGLKAWLMGHAVLYDPQAVIGHRFRDGFDNFTVAPESIIVNKLRMARKNFTDPTWEEWLKRFQARQPKKAWAAAWSLFLKGRASLERERKYLLAHRERDELWFARRFELHWPRQESAAATTHQPRRKRGQPGR